MYTNTSQKGNKEMPQLVVTATVFREALILQYHMKTNQLENNNKPKNNNNNNNNEGYKEGYYSAIFL